ncbi:hypothetical protein JW930_04230 [Candidatus Woesearchaeota archaeon]|nr:hypothetical protein [Candidatus Woesearchaeota archaeon]
MKIILKKPGLKLLKIFLESSDNKIKSIKITGDFFIYPEESIDKLETELTSIEIDEWTIKKRINNFVKKNNIRFFGITTEAITEAILKCK